MGVDLLWLFLDAILVLNDKWDHAEVPVFCFSYDVTAGTIRHVVFDKEPNKALSQSPNLIKLSETQQEATDSALQLSDSTTQLLHLYSSSHCWRTRTEAKRTCIELLSDALTTVLREEMNQRKYSLKIPEPTGHRIQSLTETDYSDNRTHRQQSQSDTDCSPCRTETTVSVGHRLKSLSDTQFLSDTDSAAVGQR